MWKLGWIDPSEYPFDCMLRMERFQIRLILDYLEDADRPVMGIALKANPKVAWLWKQKCPERAGEIDALAASAPGGLSPEQVRGAEETVLGGYEDFVIYTTPGAMYEKCDFIRGWDSKRLYEMCELTGKTVLDVGSGTGRLAFAAAEKAAFVAASEPVDALREFMRDEIAKRGLTNMRVCDGLCHILPFPDDSFDVTMSGHVVGDLFEEEVAELTRVTKNGGWLLDVPGDQRTPARRNERLLNDGWEELPYSGTFGETTYRYRKQVKKQTRLKTR
ncbi:MAG: methyltransferase domain-containing protein [Clostridia bacterium]|nr:methyltransferase domain-containing protein [Clostridia bacterium]